MQTKQKYAYRTLSVVCVMVSLLGMVSISWAQWEEKAPMPTARWGLSTSVVNGMIYAIGGWDGPGGAGAHFANVEAYDPATDTWTEKAPMPMQGAAFSTSVVNGIIYAIGGTRGHEIPLSTVDAYDPATDTWTTGRADMPTARHFHSASEVNGVIYVIGGGDALYSGEVALSTVEAYDPTLETSIEALFWGALKATFR